jgi:hypothetical protein
MGLGTTGRPVELKLAAAPFSDSFGCFSSEVVQPARDRLASIILIVPIIVLLNIVIPPFF